MRGVQLSGELVEQGFSFDELTRMARRGSLRRVRRGAYVAGDQPADPRAVHRDLVEATHKQVRLDAAVSHMSAAALHGLPIWSNELSRVHLTRDGSGGGYVRKYLHLHSAPLPADDVYVLDGLLVTTPARDRTGQAQRFPSRRPERKSR